MQPVSIIKMNILAKFHQEKTIFEEIRVTIFPILQGSDQSIWGSSLEIGYKIWSGGLTYAKFLQNMSNMIIFKVKRFEAPAVT